MVWAASTIIALGATAVSAGVAINNTNKAVKAQERAGQKANETAVSAQRDSQEFQQKQIDQARADQEPWRVAGGNALTQLVHGMGEGGDLMRNFGMSDFQQDPGYAFRQSEGMKGLTNTAAARGNLLSGAALKAASRYNQDLASAEYGSAFSRFKGNQEGKYNKLASLAGVGQIAANQNGSNAMQFGGRVGNALMETGGFVGGNMMGAGNARASGYLAQGNALTNTMNQGVSIWRNANNSSGDGNYGPSSIWDSYRPKEGDNQFIGPTQG